jgi:hypothetical protein
MDFNSMMTPPPEGTVHEAMHDFVAHTPDPNAYHDVPALRGVIIPHIPPGMSGAGGSLDLRGANSEKVESMVGDGASTAFDPNAPRSRVTINILENIKTGEETKANVDLKEFFREDRVQLAIASANSPAERMKRLVEMKDDGQANKPMSITPGVPIVRQDKRPSLSPNAAFNKALENDLVYRPSPQEAYELQKSQQHAQGSTDFSALIGQLIKEIRQPVQVPGDYVEEPKKQDPNLDYSEIGMPWLKVVPQAPKVTVVFDFGVVSHKAKFSAVEEWKTGNGLRCLYLAVDERFDGNWCFPEPSNKPFRIAVPDKNLDMTVYDAGMRLPLGDKLTFIILLEAEPEEDETPYVE